MNIQKVGLAVKTQIINFYKLYKHVYWLESALLGTCRRSVQLTALFYFNVFIVKSDSQKRWDCHFYTEFYVFIIDSDRQ
jgi:hypothetical protein